MANLVSVILAIAGALTVVAYRHPDGYERLHWAIRAILVAAAVGAIGWGLGESHMAAALGGVIDPGKLGEAMKAREAATLSPVPAMPVIIAIWAYCEFLGFLPMILSQKKPGQG